MPNMTRTQVRREPGARPHFQNVLSSLTFLKTQESTLLPCDSRHQAERQSQR